MFLWRVSKKIGKKILERKFIIFSNGGAVSCSHQTQRVPHGKQHSSYCDLSKCYMITSVAQKGLLFFSRREKTIFHQVLITAYHDKEPKNVHNGPRPAKID